MIGLRSLFRASSTGRSGAMGYSLGYNRHAPRTEAAKKALVLAPGGMGAIRQGRDGPEGRGAWRLLGDRMLRRITEAVCYFAQVVRRCVRCRLMSIQTLRGGELC
jgi:hypothetical protein